MLDRCAVMAASLNRQCAVCHATLRLTPNERFRAGLVALSMSLYSPKAVESVSKLFPDIKLGFHEAPESEQLR